MKLSKYILASAVALFASATVSYADLVVNITGATAFRAAAHTSIIAALGGAGVTQYAFSTATGAAAANLATADRAIFVGTVANIPGTVTVRASWSGSTAGIASVVNATTVSVPLLNTTVSITGVNGIGTVANNFQAVVPKFSFSDVAQAASNTPTPALTGNQVGVVPFQFIAQKGAPLGITNMTDQLHAALYSTGSVPLSTFTGSSADEATLVVATGRNNGSGTRVTILAETGYGFNTTVQQFQPTITGVTPNSSITSLGSATNNGYSSNSGVRIVLEANPLPGFLVASYLTISDATQAIANGAKGLTYNGVPYSVANVVNGQYSLWGYQWFYQAAGLNADETEFVTSFVAAIPANLGTAGIPIPDMKVTRQGGDGGPIFTNL